MNSGSRHQSGGILIGLMMLLIIASSLAVLRHTNRSPGTPLDRDAKTTKALQAAREALMARAILDSNRPGSLPCPDIATNIPGNNEPGDGKADLLDGDDCPAYAGWLPWRTLGLDDPRDVSGERLWYALSPNFRDSNLPININTASNLCLDGQGGIVALVIAPGSTLDSQNRPSNDIADYLDGTNKNPGVSALGCDNAYVTGPAGSAFNDKIIALDTTTLFNALAMRILGEIRYAAKVTASASLPEAESNGRFPSSAYPTTKSTSWPDELWSRSLSDNLWFQFITYNPSTRTVSLNGHSVTLP